MTIEEILARKYADARGYHAEDVKDAYQAGIEKAEKDYTAILQKECPPCYHTDKENRILMEERGTLADEISELHGDKEFCAKNRTRQEKDVPCKWCAIVARLRMR